MPMSQIFLLPRRSSPWYFPSGITPSDLLGAWQPKNAPSQAASYTPIAGDSIGTLSTTSDPAWHPSIGWDFNGTDQYLQASSVDLSDSLSFVVRFAGAQQVSANWVFGWTTTSGTDHPAVGVSLYSSGDDYIFGVVGDQSASKGSALVNKTITAGVVCISKDFMYIHGDFGYDMSFPGLSFSINGNLIIGAWNNSGPAAFFTGSIAAFAVYNKTLSLAQMRSIAAKLATL